METRAEKAVVLAVTDRDCLVRMEPESADQCRQCGLCVQAAQQQAERRTLRVALTTPVKAGDRVAVETRMPDPAISAFVLFCLPMIACAFGACIGLIIAEAAAWSKGVMVLAGICLALPVGLAVIKAIERRWKNQGAFTARIVPTPLTDAEAENASVWNGEANVRQR